MAQVHFQLSSGVLSDIIRLNLEEVLLDDYMAYIKNEIAENFTEDIRWKKYINSRSQEFIGFKECPFYKENIEQLREIKLEEIKSFNTKHSQLIELFETVDEKIEIVVNDDVIEFKAYSDGIEVQEFNSENDNVLTRLFANISEQTEEDVTWNLPLIDYNRQQLQNPRNLFFEKITNEFYGDLNQLFHLGEANWDGANEYKTGIEFNVHGTKVPGEGYLAEAKLDNTGIVWKLTELEEDEF